MKRKLVGILVALVLAIVGTVSLVGYVEKAKNDAIEDDAQVEVLVVQRDIPSGATLAVIAAAVAPTQVPKRLVSTDALVSLDGVDPTLVAAFTGIIDEVMEIYSKYSMWEWLIPIVVPFQAIQRSICQLCCTRSHLPTES